MSNQKKQEELKEMANHTIGNCFGNHSCFYMNLPTENTDSQNDEAIANEIVNRINQEVTSVLEELEKNMPSPPFVSFERCRTTEDYNVRQAERVVAKDALEAIQQLKQRYGGK